MSAPRKDELSSFLLHVRPIGVELPVDEVGICSLFSVHGIVSICVYTYVSCAACLFGWVGGDIVDDGRWEGGGSFGVGKEESTYDTTSPISINRRWGR